MLLGSTLRNLLFVYVVSSTLHQHKLCEMADSVLSEKLLITESAESFRGTSVFTDPYERSVKYMETHNILQIFQVRKNKAAATDIFSQEENGRQ